MSKDPRAGIVAQQPMGGFGVFRRNLKFPSIRDALKFYPPSNPGSGYAPPNYAPPQGYRWALVTDLGSIVTDINEYVWDIERIS